jgi:hypothetical protein
VLDRVFGFNVAIPACELLKLVHEISGVVDIPSESPAFVLAVVGLPMIDDRHPNVVLTEATQIFLSTRERAKRNVCHDGDDASSDAECEAEEDINGLLEHSSDAGATASSADSAACVEHEEHLAPDVATERLDSLDDEGPAQAPRCGFAVTHVVEANDPRASENDPNYPDV